MLKELLLIQRGRLAVKGHHQMRGGYKQSNTLRFQMGKYIIDLHEIKDPPFISFSGPLKGFLC